LDQALVVDCIVDLSYSHTLLVLLVLVPNQVAIVDVIDHGLIINIKSVVELDIAIDLLDDVVLHQD